MLKTFSSWLTSCDEREGIIQNFCPADTQLLSVESFQVSNIARFATRCSSPRLCEERCLLVRNSSRFRELVKFCGAHTPHGKIRFRLFHTEYRFARFLFYRSYCLLSDDKPGRAEGGALWEVATQLLQRPGILDFANLICLFEAFKPTIN